MVSPQVGAQFTVCLRWQTVVTGTNSARIVVSFLLSHTGIVLTLLGTKIDCCKVELFGVERDKVELIGLDRDKVVSTHRDRQ